VHPSHASPRLIGRLDSRRGRSKTIWGTDYPLVRHPESIERIKALGLKDETLRAVLHDNAAAVFDFDRWR
jgi:predicted TIM-barrel fold metal-dependent hydrolase